MQRHSVLWLSLLRWVLLLTSVVYTTTALALSSKEINHEKLIQEFIGEMQSDYQFTHWQITRILRHAEVRSDILAKISKPYESKPWPIYRNLFLTHERIHNGYIYSQTHAQYLQSAEQHYGVPANIILGILGVETSYGINQGAHRVIDALTTLAFYYPPRSDFFFDELKHFLVMCQNSHLDPLSVKGSYAGAMGIGQFMPSSYRNYAIDFDGNHRADLMHSHADAIASVANYLKMHGWKKNQPVAILASLSKYKSKKFDNYYLSPEAHTIAQWHKKGVVAEYQVNQTLKARLFILQDGNEQTAWLVTSNFDTILTYNRSPLYAMAVYELGQRIKQQYADNDMRLDTYV